MLTRVTSALFCAVLLVTAALPVLAQSQESATIIVRVTDAASGKPIDNAEVFLLGGDTPQNSLTNAKGLLIFDELQPAYYRIQVQADGYRQTQTTPVEVDEGQRVDVAVKLAPLLKTIADVVVHSSVSVSVQSVNEESAQRKVSQSLSDALNKIAGVSVDEDLYGGDSAFNISLRGASASQTGFSIDGMRVAGAPAQALGGLQDLFSGASVDFSPSAMGSAGSVNFFTVQPTKVWNYSFTGVAGNYGNTLGAWTVTGGHGPFALAMEHAAGGEDSPLAGKYYADQTGSAYVHDGGFARTSDLFKAAVTLSPVSKLSYTLLAGDNRNSVICASATTLLPCSDGPGNAMHGKNQFQSLAFSSLAGHLQYNAMMNRGGYHFTSSQPNRSVDGRVSPYSSDSVVSWSNATFYVSATSRRHTISAGGFASSIGGEYESTFNAARVLHSGVTQRFGSFFFNDKVKANDKLALTHRVSQASGTGQGNSLHVGESVTWQPKRADVFEASADAGSTGPTGAYTGTIGDALSADYDCYNRSVFVPGPADTPRRQTSVEYSLGWRHTLKGGFLSASLYRNSFAGTGARAAVPIGVEPPSLFPNGPAAFLTSIENVWSQPTMCGGIPFQDARVFVSQQIAGLSEIAQGIDLNGEIPIGKNVVVFPRYALTSAYYSTLDPRLTVPGSYYVPGAQIPHAPLRTAGLIVDGILPHASAEWLIDAEYTSANNPQNLPGYTIYNAGVIFNGPRGSIRLFAGNLFGTHTGLFTTYQGVNPMPVQGGGTFAYATAPLPPRSLTIEYRVRWRQHVSPPKTPQKR